MADNGQFYKRHIDQMRRRSRLSDVTCPEGNDERQHGEENVIEPLSKGSEEVTLPETEAEDSGQRDQGVPSEHPSPKLPSPPVTPVSRYSRRTRKPVDRFE